MNELASPNRRPEVKIVLRRCGLTDPGDIGSAVSGGAYRGLEKALSMPPEQVAGEVSRSGLRGRGGAGFPAGEKWLACRNAPGEEKYLIANAHESDPESLAGRTLLEGDPHAVLEGMAIAAYAAGASLGYIFIRRDADGAIAAIENALEQMAAAGFAGENIRGSGFSFRIELRRGEADFTCGEETAMLRALEGKRTMAYPRPPYPAVSGLKGRPTVVNNVETLANVPVILEKGAAWHSGCGTQKSPGTKILTISGNVKHPGVTEVPLGTTLRQVIREIGGGTADGREIRAVEVGGPTGGLLPVGALDTPIDYEELAGAGAAIGSGGIVVAGGGDCIVNRAGRLAAFGRAASCGACVICREGTAQIDEIMKDITAGKGQPEHIGLLLELGEALRDGSLCGLGRTAPNPVLTMLEYFREELEAHVREKRCPAGVCPGLNP